MPFALGNEGLCRAPSPPSVQVHTPRQLAEPSVPAQWVEARIAAQQQLRHDMLIHGAIQPAPLPVQPDLKHPPAFLVAEGDMVVIGGGLPQPDPERPGEYYDYLIVDTFRVRDGKLVEHWSSINKIAPPKPPA